MIGAMKRILYLTDEGITVFLVDGRTLAGKRCYGFDSEGMYRFEADIAELPELDTRLVLDITEEEFFEERLPHVFHHDQVKLLERRRRQRFRGSRWWYLEKVDRAKDGRREDIFLLTGITREEVLEPVLEVLERHCVPMAAMTSVPLLTPALARGLRVRQAHSLFVSHGERGGIRQTFLEKGHLKASRLAPTPRYDAQQYAEQIQSEVMRMRMFLQSSHYLPMGERLDVYLFSTQEIINLVSRSVQEDDLLRFHYYNLLAVKERFHFRGVSQHEHADAMYALLAATRKGLRSYARHGDRRGYYVRRTAQALNAASLAVMVAGVGLMATNALEVREAREAIQQVHGEIALYRRKTEAVRSKRPPEEVSGFLMADAVEFHERVVDKIHPPFRSLTSLGQTLLGHPHIQLTHITTNQGAISEDGVEPHTDYSSQTPVDEARPAAARIELEGVVEEPGATYRQVVTRFRRLLESLRDNPHFEQVEVQRWPVEIRPEHTLVVDGRAMEDHEKGWRFAFSLVPGGAP